MTFAWWLAVGGYILLRFVTLRYISFRVVKLKVCVQNFDSQKYGVMMISLLLFLFLYLAYELILNDDGCYTHKIMVSKRGK